jgi:hypothetical protein
MREKTTVHCAWEMVRVVCTLLVKRLDGGVLCSQVAWTSSCFGGSIGMIEMQGLSATYVVWLEIPNSVLIDSDRCYFSIIVGYRN